MGVEGVLVLENTSPPDSNSNRGFSGDEKKILLSFIYLNTA